MLHVDDAHYAIAAEDGHGEEGLKLVLGQFNEKLKARVLESVAPYRDGLAVLGNPAGDALSHGQLQPVHNIRMGIHGSAQYQIVVLKKVDQAGIAFHHSRHKCNHAVKNFVQLAGSYTSSDVVQKIDFGSFKKHCRNLPNEHKM